MRDPSQYYAKFEDGIAAHDIALSEEFRALAKTHTPRQIFLWLENLKREGRFPDELEQLLVDFYGLFC